MDKPRNDVQPDRTIRELARLLQESQRIAGLGSYLLDLQTNLWSSSDVLDEFLGIETDYERSVDGWVALIHPEDRDDMSAYFSQEVLAGDKRFDREYRIVRRSDHAPRWAHGMGRLERDESGKAILTRGTIQA